MTTPPYRDGGPGRSGSLSRRAREVIPHGVNSPVRHYDPYPFFADRARGSRIWDVDGNEMIDMCNGYGAALLGHRHPDVVSAVSEQLRRGVLYGAPTEAETVVSELLHQHYPSMDMSRMVNTGGEATMTAIRLARGYTGRPNIVMFEGCYHGAHDSVLVRAGSGAAHSESSSAGILPDTPNHTILAKYNDIESFCSMMESREDVAGVIMEPVMANMGLVPPEKGFLEGVRRITKNRSVPLIFDEVVTGFRMSPGGAQQYYSVTPDMTTLAKALGNGFAVAAVGGRRDIMEQLAPGGPVYQASTFAGNPVAAAAATASMRAMDGMTGTIHNDMHRHCSRLAGAIRDAAADLSIPHRVHHVSSMLQIFFSDSDIRDYTTAKRSDAVKFRRLFDGLLERGVFVAPSQYETAFLSGAMTGDDIDDISRAYRDSLGALAG